MQGCILRPDLFKICMDDLEDENVLCHIKFALDTTLGEVVNILKAQLPSRRTYTSCRNWAKMNLMEFSNDKCKVLHLERNNTLQQYTACNAWLGSSFAEEDLGPDRQ